MFCINKKLINEIAAELVPIRRQIHANPELGFQEFKTAELIETYLRKLNFFKLQTAIAQTGIVAVIQGELDGPGLAFRADLDALPILETTNLEYESKIPGVMHACGHDGHIVILLGLAKILNDHKANIRGTVKLIFQPAEEFGAGAKVMIEQGVLENPKVDYIFGLHGWPQLAINQIGLISGAFFAGVRDFEIIVSGQGGHAAFPEHCKDPLLPAVEVFSAIKKQIHNSKNLKLGLAAFQAGSFYNVIPTNAKIMGTIRFFNESDLVKVISKIQNIIKNISDQFDIKIELLTPGIEYPALYNSELVSHQVDQILAQSDFENCNKNFPVFTGEDFAFFLNQVPGAFITFGLKRDRMQELPELHNSNFDFPDQAIATGIKLLSQIAFNYTSKV